MCISNFFFKIFFLEFRFFCLPRAIFLIVIIFNPIIFLSDLYLQFSFFKIFFLEFTIVILRKFFVFLGL